MSDEIKAAAERFSARTIDGYDSLQGKYLWQCCNGKRYEDAVHEDDVGILARAYLAAEAAREAELAERAKELDGEWLVSLGFDLKSPEFLDGPLCLASEFHEIRISYGIIVLHSVKHPKRPGIKLGDCITTTRGMMLDVLSSLKIPTKQQQNDTIDRKAETVTDVGGKTQEEVSEGR